MKIVNNLEKEKYENNNYMLKCTESEYLYYDMSKTHCTEQDKNKIKKKILENDFNLRQEGMRQGKDINYTEKRPVLHYLLRDPCVLNKLKDSCCQQNKIACSHENICKKPESNEKESEESKNKQCCKNSSCSDEQTTCSDLTAHKNDITCEFLKIKQFVNNFKDMKGITGKKLDTIVNIGIGGSDLGPRMITKALEYYAENTDIHFISNIDPSETLRVFKSIDIETALFIVVSKTFTTVETIENFKLSLGLFTSFLNDKYSSSEICNKHFVAVSSNIEETSKYGICTVFKMWDFVGGRYSLWSAVGLSIALYVGFDNFVRLLQGASVADKDFFENKLDSVAAKLAINELFYIEQGYNNKCIVCYDSYLSLFYKYMQQAEMESNGKHGSKQMIIWGGVGTDVQHSFFQQLHQGEQNVYLEFLCPINTLCSEYTAPAVEANMKQIKSQQKQLAAACLAQSMSMMIGKQSQDINNHFEGNKPSVTVLYSKLTPETLGAMLAVYEHKIFIEGVYFNINSFDQFGVTLGKSIANDLLKEMQGDLSNSALDISTQNLIKHLK